MIWLRGDVVASSGCELGHNVGATVAAGVVTQEEEAATQGLHTQKRGPEAWWRKRGPWCWDGRKRRKRQRGRRLATRRTLRSA
jgi:hypothetical protein